MADWVPDWVLGGLWWAAITAAFYELGPDVKRSLKNLFGRGGAHHQVVLQEHVGVADAVSTAGFSDFDLSIEEAIDHWVETAAHSFDCQPLAEQAAFKVLHEAMCAGRLAVIGQKGETAPLKRISRRQCKKLHRIEVTTPHGMRFHLVDQATKERAPGEYTNALGFSGLRVRSRDLYALWPRNRQPAKMTDGR